MTASPPFAAAPMIARRTIHFYPGELADAYGALVAPPDDRTALLAAFEDAFTRHMGAGHAVPVGSGRLGLRLILGALGIGAGHEVVLPAFTDESVPEAIRAVGATPRFVDVDRDTMNLGVDGVAAALGPATRAVLATHIFGNPCDVKSMARLLEARPDVALLEDCAHAIDASLDGHHCGTFGRAAMFSFVVTKAVNTFGGGMVLAANLELAAQIRERASVLPAPAALGLVRRIAIGLSLSQATTRKGMRAALGLALRTFDRVGVDPVAFYDRTVRGGTQNAQIDTAFSAVQAAVALPQLRALPATQARRNAIAERLRQALGPNLRAQRVLPGAQHAWYFVVATTEDVPDVVRRALTRGVDLGVRPMRCVADDPSAFPNAAWLESHTVQIPAYPELSDLDVVRIASALRR